MKRIWVLALAGIALLALQIVGLSPLVHSKAAFAAEKH